jgi:hypothetical protein
MLKDALGKKPSWNALKISGEGAERKGSKKKKKQIFSHPTRLSSGFWTSEMRGLNLQTLEHF